MRIFVSFVAIAVAVATSAAASAGFIYDNFTTAGTVTGAGQQNSGTQVVFPSGVTRNLQTANSTLTVGAGTATGTLAATNNSVRFEFGSFGTKDLFTANQYQNILRFTAAVATGMKYKIDYAFTTAGNVIKTFTTGTLTGSGANTAYDFNAATLGAALQNTSAVKIRITKLAGSTAGANNIAFSGNIASIPEPGSMALLGLTGLAGMVINRRRKAKSTTAV